MNVTIIGAGKMARGIGTRLVAGGYSVTLHDRDAKKAADLKTQLQSVAKGEATVLAQPYGSPVQGEVVVLALPYTAVAEVIHKYHDLLGGKIVVDITNPLTQELGLATPPGSSAAEEIARQLPANAKVIKAFNTTFVGPLTAGSFGGHPIEILVAGDDAEAKKTVMDLIDAGKLTAVDAGPLQRARQLENMALLGIALQFSLGTQFQSAWKLLR